MNERLQIYAMLQRLTMLALLAFVAWHGMYGTAVFIGVCLFLLDAPRPRPGG